MIERSGDPLRELRDAIDRIRDGEKPVSLESVLEARPELRSLFEEAMRTSESQADSEPTLPSTHRTIPDQEGVEPPAPHDATRTIPMEKQRIADEAVQAFGQSGVCGPYRILERLGEGGMGVVFVAEQREPIRRKVALKLIKWGLDTKDVLTRFELEHHALALMDHPNIARVIDSGATSMGRPYFVMEYVPGVPLVEYCDRHRLGVRERLELFIVVCEAVQHAHQKGVIHRDLKPSNILVALLDGRPVPKVIDFGVAKAINQPLTQQTLYTEVGRIVGTLEYMSPEQADPTAVDVDTRSDVYALGVILYELLTGRVPFQANSLRQGGLAEMQRIIREVEPQKPSTRLSSLAGESEPAAERRRSDSRLLARRLRGDLDWITMKCLEKDRARRYDGAAALADDLRRHLGGEPVNAGPPSRWYRWSKLVQKHRAACITVIAVTLALVGGLGVSLWGLNRAVDAEERAARLAVREGRRADAQRIDEAVARLGTLWPATPATIGEFENWLSEYARPLAGRLEVHRRDLDRLKSQSPEEAAALAPEFDRDAEIAFLSRLVERLESFVLGDGPDGAAVEIENRLAFARSLEVRTVRGREVAKRWREALASIERSPLYAAAPVPLTPQLGLVPLGTDPASGLEEFLHLASHEGAIPERSADGSLPRTPELGVVLVLVPGFDAQVGAVRPALGLGARAVEGVRALEVYRVVEGSLAEAWGIEEGDRLQSVAGIPTRTTKELVTAFEYAPTDAPFDIELVRAGTPQRCAVDWRAHALEPHQDPWARTSEGPVREVELGWYFIGKFEVTQAQWRRGMRHDPSMYDHEYRLVVDREVVHENSGLNPVELISWYGAQELARRWNLVLPSADQWEWAARGGTTTPWWSGPVATSVEAKNAANLADSYARTYTQPLTWTFEDWRTDRHLVHAPVGTFAPNGYGLHDTAGNLWEWCRDTYETRTPIRNADFRITRGGSFRSAADRCRVTASNHLRARHESNDLGVRFAREVHAPID